MPKQHSNTYTIVFVTVISVICALLLSVAASMLQGRISANQELDVNKNILECLDAFGKDGLPAKKEAKADDVKTFFSSRIEATIVNPMGEELPTEGVTISKLRPWKDVTDSSIDRKDLKLPVYILKAADGESVAAYCIPVWGKGLWGAIYGYLAIEPDGETVRGITFLSNHKETPGLGARIVEAEWRAQWKAKTIFNADGKLAPITLIKGGVRPDSKKASHQVDGISGATMTCKGVSQMMIDCLELYEPFLRKVKAKGSTDG